MVDLLASFKRLDAQLEKAGVYPCSEWWMDQHARFYEHPTARLFAARVGRGGDKSRNLVKAAINETLFGDFKVPPGERHYYAFVSISKTEAAERLHQISHYLNALGVKYTQAGDAIDLAHMPRGFRVNAASVAANSGFRAFGWALDEAAKLRTTEGVHNAAELAASARAMTATHPGARGRIVSSPLSSIDYHFKVIELGNTASQIVAIAPSWIANPSVTQESTRALEPDYRLWLREYGAEPADPDEGLITSDDIARCTRKGPLEIAPYQRAGMLTLWATDPATRIDTWPLVGVNTWREADGLRHQVILVKEWRPRNGFEPLSPGIVLANIAAVLRRYGCKNLVSDQASGDALRDIAARVGIRLFVQPTTAASKVESFETLRTLIATQRIELPPLDTLRDDLLSLRRRYTNTGSTIALPRSGGRHADSAVALALAVRNAESGSAAFQRRDNYNRRAQRALVAFSAAGLSDAYPEDAAQAIMAGRMTIDDHEYMQKEGV